MDKVTRYQTLIQEGLTHYADLLESSFPKIPFAVTLAFDNQRRQYLLREIGWTKNERVQRTILHVTIHNDKIWIEEDWTEEGIATYFLEHKVPHQDIVLGFQPPQMHPLTEFAAS